MYKEPPAPEIGGRHIHLYMGDHLIDHIGNIRRSTFDYSTVVKMLMIYESQVGLMAGIIISEYRERMQVITKGHARCSLVHLDAHPTVL